METVICLIGLLFFIGLFGVSIGVLGFLAETILSPFVAVGKKIKRIMAFTDLKNSVCRTADEEIARCGGFDNISFFEVTESSVSSCQRGGNSRAKSFINFDDIGFASINKKRSKQLAMAIASHIGHGTYVHSEDWCNRVGDPKTVSTYTVGGNFEYTVEDPIKMYGITPSYVVRGSSTPQEVRIETSSEYSYVYHHSDYIVIPGGPMDQRIIKEKDEEERQKEHAKKLKVC